MQKRISSARKRKTDEACAPTTTKRIKLSYGVPNYLPPIADGEDDETMAIHVSFLKRQARLDPSLQEHEKVASKMEKTFPQRRDLIVMREASVAEMRDNYPILFSKEQVC